MRKPICASARIRIFCSDASIAIATHRVDAQYTKREQEFSTLSFEISYFSRTVDAFESILDRRFILN